MFLIKKARSSVQAIRKSSVKTRLRAFLDKKEPELVQFLQTLWNQQGKAISYREIREAILNGEFAVNVTISGAAAEQWLDGWRQDYAKFVQDYMLPAWLAAMAAGAKEIESKFPGWKFSAAEQGVQNWLKTHGAQFVTNSTQTQINGLRVVLQHAADSGLHTEELSRVIRPMIGLTYPQCMANIRYHNSMYLELIKNDVKPQAAAQKALHQSIRYSERQHRYRAQNIARTELAFAYNHGVLFGVKQAQKVGLMGAVVKRWITADDERTCSICGNLNNATIGIDEDFQYRQKRKLIPINPKLTEPSIHQAPPAHPSCRCSVLFEEVSPPDPAARFDEIEEIGQLNGLNPEDRYDIIEEIGAVPEHWRSDMSQYTNEDGSLNLEKVKRAMAARVTKLPKEQKDALENYTGFAATEINTAIRQHRITPEIQRKIDLLDEALKKGVMPATVTLHRDTVFSFIADNFELPTKPTEEELFQTVKQTISNPIFTSTSFENLKLPGRNTELWLTIPAGYRECQFIQPVARDKFKNQVEVLFARGMRYKITKAKLENGKYIILWAEVLQ